MAEHEDGQAQVELVAAVPFVVLSVLLVLQLFGLLYAQSVADGAAQAGALAGADGRSAARAARAATGGWGRDRVEVELDGGRVRVEIQPPAMIPWVGDRLVASSSAYARSAGRSAG